MADGHGLAGFASGFLQGFDTVGRNLNARRELELQARRQDLLDALESRKLDQADRDRELKAQELPGLNALRKAQAESQSATARGQSLENQAFPETQRAKIAGQEAQTAYQQAGAEHQRASAGLAGVQQQEQALENQQVEREQALLPRWSAAAQRLMRGEGSAEDALMLRPALDISQNKDLLGDYATVVQGVQAAAQETDNGAKVAVINQPEVLGALNRTFGGAVNHTRGQLKTDDGYTVDNTSIANVVMHPDGKRLGLVLSVDESKDGQTRQRQVGLTEGRTPVDQGGVMRWFSPEELSSGLMGVRALGELLQAQPELRNRLADLKTMADAGLMPKQGNAGASLDDQVKVEKLNLDQNRDAREASKALQEELKTFKDERTRGMLPDPSQGMMPTPEELAAYRQLTDRINRVAAAHPKAGAAEWGRLLDEENQQAGKAARGSGQAGIGATPRAQRFTTLWGTSQP